MFRIDNISVHKVAGHIICCGDRAKDNTEILSIGDLLTDGSNKYKVESFPMSRRLGSYSYEDNIYKIDVAIKYNGEDFSKLNGKSLSRVSQ